MIRKFLATLLFLFLILAGLLFFAKDRAAKVVFETVVRNLTGLEARAGSVDFDLQKGALQVKELTLINTPEFKSRLFGDATEVFLEMDLPALLKNEKVHLRELRLDIRELNVEKTPAGVSNVSLLAALWKRPSAQRPAVSEKKRPFQLDRFALTLRRVTYNDRSGLVPKRFSVKVPPEKKVYGGITNSKAIMQIIVMRAVSESPIGNLGINAMEVHNQLKRSFGGMGRLSGNVITRSGGVGRKLLEEGRGTLTSVGNATRDEVAELFKKLRATIEQQKSEKAAGAQAPASSRPVRKSSSRSGGP